MKLKHLPPIALAAFIISALILLTPQLLNGQDDDMRRMAGLDVERGVVASTKGHAKGYKLFAQIASDMFYLIDEKGQVVHTWKCKYGTGPAYLMDNGHIFTTGRDPNSVVFAGGGQGGYLLEYDWNGNLLWEYKYSSD